MPRIDRLRIHNFRGASTPIELTFSPNKPLVLIFGENGTGKTTIVDALDAVGNARGGSLTTKSSTTLRTHLPTVGKKPSDMTLEVSSGPSTWTATLGRSGIVTAPTPGPPIHVLRRVNLQRFVDSAPADRYKELKHLIGVERVERAEEALKRARDAANQQLDDAVRARSAAEEQLASIWQTEGRPGADWRGWAREAGAADPADLRRGVDRSRATREAIAVAARAKTAWEGAEAALANARQAVATVDADVAQGPALDAASLIALADLLGRVRSHLGTGDHADRCPVCEQDIPLPDLRRSLAERLATLARYQDLSARRRTADDRLRTAEDVTRRATAALVSAAERVAAIAVAPPDGFAPISLPPPVLAALAESAARSEERTEPAFDLIAACEPLVAALQAEEDAALQAGARVASVRELSARAEESRAQTVALERTLKGLLAAHEVVRLERLGFTQRILDDVAEECNRLYAQIHPDEGIAIAKIELDQQRRASINQSMTFAGYTEIVPQAYLSEAHLDTFGFCFWLAFAKREHPSGDAVLVLDDIFTSVDAPHLGRVTGLIVQERANFAQIIITTHQRAWQNAFRNGYAPANLTDLIELQSWSLAQGIFSYQTAPAIGDLRTALRALPFNRQATAATAGILLEATLDRLTFLYRSKVPRTRNNVYTLGELLDVTDKLFKKLEIQRPIPEGSGAVPAPAAYETVSPAELFRRLRESAYVRNQVGAHHNEQGMELADGDVRAFAELAAQLVESLVCPGCGQLPTTPNGTHYRCSCAPKPTAQMTPLQFQ